MPKNPTIKIGLCGRS